MQPHDTHRKRLIKLVDEVGRAEGRAQYEVFRDFLDAGYRAIRGTFLKGDAWQQNEDEYMKIVKHCRKPTETMGRYAEMLAVTTEALEAECSDFLGPTFMEVGGSKDLGQFFTPNSLSKMMAMMTLDLPKLIDGSPRGYFTGQEPAAGMGGMVLAAAEVMREKGYDPARHCHWLMVDVEFKAMAGCYIQTSLCGVSGFVTHGNTLSLAEWASSPTPMAVLFPKRFGQVEIEPLMEADMPAAAELPAPLPATKKGTSQMAFDFSC
jgi:hypothetical protein